MLEQEVKIDANLIESFKSQKELHGELDKYSDSELMKRMNKEIKDYAFGLWVKEKRKESKIEYLKLYDKYKKDCLVSFTARAIRPSELCGFLFAFASVVTILP